MLCPTAVVGWVVSLLVFVATALMALDGWDTNIGAGAALLVALHFAFLSGLITIAAVVAWAVGRVRGQLTEPYVPLRNLLWGATAVLVLGAAMLLFTGFHLTSPGVVYLLGGAVVTGITAVVVSVNPRQESHRRATG
ncbi:hypothetical protein [Corynebacterium sp. A21]|uniref:hypothetical protein n=1 Tax=Corynebacterium sp. A21 TaxID=3457318 RepID=UPI003FD23BA9